MSDSIFASRSRATLDASALPYGAMRLAIVAPTLHLNLSSFLLHLVFSVSRVGRLRRQEESGTAAGSRIKRLLDETWRIHLSINPLPTRSATGPGPFPRLGSGSRA